MTFFKKNTDIISWWKHKSILFNIITLSYLLLHLLLFKILFLQPLGPFLLPEITGYIILANLYYYAALFIIIIFTKKDISISQTRSAHKLLISCTLLILIVYSVCQFSYSQRVCKSSITIAETGKQQK